MHHPVGPSICLVWRGKNLAIGPHTEGGRFKYRKLRFPANTSAVFCSAKEASLQDGSPGGRPGGLVCARGQGTAKGAAQKATENQQQPNTAVFGGHVGSRLRVGGFLGKKGPCLRRHSAGRIGESRATLNRPTRPVVFAPRNSHHMPRPTALQPAIVVFVAIRAAQVLPR